VIVRLFFGFSLKDLKVNGNDPIAEFNYITEHKKKYNSSGLRAGFGDKVLNLFKDYRQLKARIKSYRSFFNDII